MSIMLAALGFLLASPVGKPTEGFVRPVDATTTVEKAGSHKGAHGKVRVKPEPASNPQIRQTEILEELRNLYREEPHVPH